MTLRRCEPTPKRENTLIVLQIFREVAKTGRFQRSQIASTLKISKVFAESRWYNEIKRMKRCGACFDWRTQLLSILLAYSQYAEARTALIALIEQIIQMFLCDAPPHECTLRVQLAYNTMARISGHQLPEFEAWWKIETQPLKIILKKPELPAVPPDIPSGLQWLFPREKPTEPVLE